MSGDGASSNEQLLYAARTDNDDMIVKIFEHEVEAPFDINCTDSLGNTPLHLAVSNGATSVLEHILSHENCDVDPQNKLDKETPLHLAIKIEDPDLRHQICESLLEAGADTKIRNKQGYTVLFLLGDRDPDLRNMLRKAQAQASVSKNDIARDDDEGSGPESGSEQSID